MNPEISVIVPVYNVGEPLLRACIESALAQTFTDFELILVDDASTDNSAAVCASYKDPRIRLLRLSKNGGVSNARNKGITIASGRYFSFLDADDKLVPDTLLKLHKAITTTGADIVAADFIRVCADCRSGHNNHTTSEHNSCTKILTPSEAVADILYQRVLDNSPCAKLICRKICTALPFPTGRYEDLLIVPQWFLAANKIAYLPEPLYLYTDNPASYLNTFNLGRAVVLDVTDELVRFMERHHPELVAAAHDRALSASFNILNLMAANGVSDPDTELRCRATIRRYRRQSFLNPCVRLKNKAGILLTYIGGFAALKTAAKIFQKP